MPQHAIKGYPVLSEDQIELINKIKEIENGIGQMMNEPSNISVDGRMGALAKTNLQQGFMWWVRAIAKPESEL